MFDAVVHGAFDESTQADAGWVAIEVDGLSKRFRGTGGNPVPMPLPGLLQRRRARNQREEVLAERHRERDDEDELDDEEDEEDEDRDELAPGAELWALRDVDLDLRAGTVLGVIGPNGSGKSTLVRVVGGITPPSRGKVTVRGRMAPPLNAAARFVDANATGRQNILTVADLFGVDRSIAEQQTPVIAAFAEIEHLLDTPVGGYSPGLRQRLGLSIAFHLEPDILLADEFPSAGDVHFRERCRAWLEDQTRTGLTMLIASHDMRSIRELCDEVMWLDQGRVLQRGEPEEVIEAYEATRLSKRRSGAPARPGAVIDYGFFSTDGHPITTLPAGDDAVLEMTLMLDAGQEVSCQAVLRMSGEPVLRSTPHDPVMIEESGPCALTAYVPAGLLAEGRHEARLRAVVYSEGKRVAVGRADPFYFDVEAVDDGDARQEAQGTRRRKLAWAVARTPDAS